MTGWLRLLFWALITWAAFKLRRFGIWRPYSGAINRLERVIDLAPSRYRAVSSLLFGVPPRGECFRAALDEWNAAQPLQK